MFINKLINKPLKLIIADIFQASLLLYLLLSLIELYRSGFASIFINLNYLLWIALISGLIMLIFGKQEKKAPSTIIQKQMQWWDYLFILFLGLAAGILIYLKISELHWIAILISAFACILIWLLAYLIFNEEEIT